MSEAVTLLTVPQALAAAAALRERVDKSLTLSRGMIGTSDVAIVSMAVLVDQLDGIAQAAAAYSTGHPDLEHYADLQERLLAAGYLPLATDTRQEVNHGQS